MRVVEMIGGRELDKDKLGKDYFERLYWLEYLH